MADGQQYNGIQVAGSVSTASADQTICSWAMESNTTARIEAICILQDTSGNTQTSYKLIANTARQDGYNSGNAYFISSASKINEDGYTNGFAITLGVSGSSILAKTASADGYTYRAACYMNIFAVEQFVDKYSTLFGGTNEFVTMGNVCNFDREYQFSVSLWTKTTASNVYLLSKMDSTPKGYGILSSAAGKLQILFANSGTVRINVSSATSINDGSWHHIIVTYEGTSLASGLTCYIDGTSDELTVTTNNLTTNSFSNTGSLNISGRTDGSVVLTGNVDEVGIYDKKLSSTEVLEIYNSGIPTNLLGLTSSANLLNWWRMGDGDTHPTLIDNSTDYIFPIVPDVSGDGYHGTATNMEVSDIQFDIPYGKCVSFGGTNEYIKTGNVLGFDSTDAFSYTFWIKSTSAATGYVLAKMEDAPNYRGYGVNKMADGTLRIHFINIDASDRLTVDTTAIVNDGNWNHVAVTYDGSSLASGVTCYINGVSVALTATMETLDGQSMLNTEEFNISGRGNGTALLVIAFVDEVSVWNKELSQSEVSEIYANRVLPVNLLATSMAANLVGWWGMGEGDVYPTIQDRSTNGYDGTMVNMEAADIQDRFFTYVNKSIVFGGTNEYITMGNVLNFERTDAFSISFWAKWTGSTYYVFLGKQQSTPEKGYTIATTTTGQVQVGILNAWNTNLIYLATTTTGFNNNQWHHIVITYDGSSAAAGVTIYVDSIAYDKTVTYDSLSDTIITGNSLYIGGRASGTPNYFVGSLDDVSIWNKELSSAETIAIYNLGVPSDLTGSANLVGYWKLGKNVGFNGTMTNMESGDIVADTPR